MPARAGIGFKVWTAALSVFVAVMLFPNIVGRHGVAKSLFITAMAVGVIWMMYFVLGLVINDAVAKELKRMSRKHPEDGQDARESDHGKGTEP